MNNKGQTMGIAILSAVIVFLIGMAIINLIMPSVSGLHTSLSCTSASTISDGTKLLCLITDTIVPYFIILIISISIGGIVSRIR